MPEAEPKFGSSTCKTVSSSLIRIYIFLYIFVVFFNKKYFLVHGKWATGKKRLGNIGIYFDSAKETDKWHPKDILTGTQYPLNIDSEVRTIYPRPDCIKGFGSKSSVKFLYKFVMILFFTAETTESLSVKRRWHYPPFTGPILFCNSVDHRLSYTSLILQLKLNQCRFSHVKKFNCSLCHTCVNKWKPPWKLWILWNNKRRYLLVSWTVVVSEGQSQC